MMVYKSLLRSSMVSLLLTLSLATPSKSLVSGCSREYDNVPRPFAFKNFFGTVTNKTWMVSAKGTIVLDDSNLLYSFKAPTKSTLNGVYFTDDWTGWVVGDDGYIARSEDGGRTWESQKSKTTQRLSSIYCLTGDVCWASGAEGTVLKTENGGKRWKNVSADTTETLRSVRFVDQNVGLVVGNRQTILKTEDGGSTWQEKNIPFDEEKLKKVMFYDLFSVGIKNEKTYCAASWSAVACTKNDGEDWKLIDNFNDNLATHFIGTVVTSDSFYFVGECENDVFTKDLLSTWKRVHEKVH